MNEVMPELLVSAPSGAPRLVTLCVHGGPGGDASGPGGLFEVLESCLPEEGIVVARFSMRGSGDTPFSDYPTLRSGVEDILHCLSIIERRYPRVPIAMVLESMGATTAFFDAASWSRRVSKLALLWPALNLFDTDMRDVLTADLVGQARLHGVVFPWGTGSPALGTAFIEECLVVDVGKNLGLFAGPTLVMHGTADTEVPYFHAERAALLLGDECRFIAVENGDHGLKRPRERALVVSEVLEFLGA